MTHGGALAKAGAERGAGAPGRSGHELFAGAVRDPWTMEPRQFDLDLHIPASPDQVRAFWTDLPDELHAREPDVQPRRVVTLGRTAEGRDLHTWWSAPDGTEFEMRERLTLEPDGSWTFEARDVMGVHVYETFEVDEAPGGSRLHVHTDLIPLRTTAMDALAKLEATLKHGAEGLARQCAEKARETK